MLKTAILKIISIFTRYPKLSVWNTHSSPRYSVCSAYSIASSVILQISLQDVDAVRRKLEQIKRELGEEALPVNKYRSARAKWKAIAKISLLARGFVPNYPDAISINPRMFIEVFPYHVILDSSMNVHQSGIKIQQLMPSIRNRSAEMKDFFRMKYPRFTEMTFENLKKFIMTPFILELRKERMSKDWTKRPPLLIKGIIYSIICYHCWCILVDCT